MVPLIHCLEKPNVVVSLIESSSTCRCSVSEAESHPASSSQKIKKYNRNNPSSRFVSPVVSGCSFTPYRQMAERGGPPVQ